jgi:pimeloyl-ACP methyl ester carboxylesterase
LTVAFTETEERRCSRAPDAGPATVECRTFTYAVGENYQTHAPPVDPKRLAVSGLGSLWPSAAEAFKGSPIEAEYKKLSPTPNEFPDFVKRVAETASKPYDFGADRLKATKAPMFFIYGDADGVPLEHISEMFRLKGGEVFGDMRPRSASRLAILPDTTHGTLMDRMAVIVPMVNDFLDAKPPKE